MPHPVPTVLATKRSIRSRTTIATNRSQGEELWKTVPATACATVRDGLITGFTITNPGSGYSSEPHVSV
jgi:hypothetical protein